MNEELERLRALCACAYQLAGQLDQLPDEWLDCLSDAANGTPLAEWRHQGDLIDLLLPVYL